MAELELTLVAEGLKFPEGPVAMSDGSVVLTEIEGKRVVRVTPDGKVNVVAETGGGPNGLAVGPDGALYVTNNGGAFQFYLRDGINIPGPAAPDHEGGSIQRIDLKTGALTSLYTHCGERALHGPNDLVFDKQGGFWFTDYGVSHSTYKIYGGLFYATPDGTAISCARDRPIIAERRGALAGRKDGLRRRHPDRPPLGVRRPGPWPIDGATVAGFSGARSLHFARLSTLGQHGR